MIKNSGFTQTPNHIIDNMASMKPSVFAICMAVVRQTCGYVDDSGKRKEWDEISISRFMQLTGLSNRAVIDAVKLAIDECWIERRVHGQCFKYRIAPVKKVHSQDTSAHEKSSQVVGGTSEKSSQADSPTCEKSSQAPVKKVHEQPVKKVHTQNKDLNKPINKIDDHLPGQFLRALIEGAGFAYLDKNFIEVATRLETDYSTEQLIRGVESVKVEHKKKIGKGERGITAPLGYLASILADERPHNVVADVTQPKKVMIRDFNTGELREAIGR